MPLEGQHGSTLKGSQIIKVFDTYFGQLHAYESGRQASVFYTFLWCLRYEHLPCKLFGFFMFWRVRWKQKLCAYTIKATSIHMFTR